MKTLTDIDAELDALAAWVPSMILDTDEASQMDAFAGRADLITDDVTPDHRDYVWSRIQCIQRDNGLIPGDGVPCSDWDGSD